MTLPPAPDRHGPAGGAGHRRSRRARRGVVPRPERVRVLARRAAIPPDRQDAFATDWDAFEASPLKRRLFEQRRLIRHERADVDLAPMPGAHAVIQPEPIEFLSYPYEWTFGELREAALLTLDIQLEAMAAGWTLKDASAYNIQFRDARPIHIDSTSFEPLEDGSPWIAYRQFCEQFLAPLVLAARRDVRLIDLLRLGTDGIPLDLASRMLPRRTWLDFGLVSHVHLHARAQTRHARNDDDGRSARQVRLSRARLEGLIREPALDRREARLAAAGNGVGGLRGEHELCRAGRGGQGPRRGRVVARGPGRAGMGPRREHRSLQPDRGRRRQARRRLRHRPRRRRAPLSGDP